MEQTEESKKNTPPRKRDKVFGEKLQNYRKKTKLTQDKFAALINVSVRTLSNWETGEFYPDEDKFQALTQALLAQNVFDPMQEKAQIRELWKLPSDKKFELDEQWLNEIIDSQANSGKAFAAASIAPATNLTTPILDTNLGEQPQPETVVTNNVQTSKKPQKAAQPRRVLLASSALIVIIAAAIVVIFVFILPKNSSGTATNTQSSTLITTNNLLGQIAVGAANNSLVYDPTGAFLMSANGDGQAKVWLVQPFSPTNAQKPVVQLTKHTNYVLTVRYSPDKKLFATSSKDGTVKFWQLGPDGKPTDNVTMTITATTTALWTMAFSPDGKTLATPGGANASDIDLWDVATGAKKNTLHGHSGGINELVFSSYGAGTTLVSVSDDKTAKVWDVSTGALVATLSEHTAAVNSLAFSPNGKIFATGGEDTNAILYDITTLKPLAILKGHTAAIYALTFSPDGQLLASGGKDGLVNVWDVTTAVSTGKATPLTLTASTNAVTCLAFNPDGKTLASGSELPEATIKIWKIKG